MSTENNPEDAQPADGQDAPASVNPLVALVRRGQAGLRRLLQRLGIHSGSTAADQASGEAGSASATREVVKEIVYVSVPADPPPLVRTIFIVLLALIIGLLAGAWFGYELFATRLDAQAEQIDEQRFILIGLEKENKGLQRDREELLEMRKTLDDTQKTLFDTQRDLSRLATFGKTRCDEQTLSRIAEREAAAASGKLLNSADDRGVRSVAPSVPRSSGRISTAAPAAAQQPGSGICDISSSNPQEALSRCIGNINP